jgi:DNA-binding PadR family transcriptional regulator
MERKPTKFVPLSAASLHILLALAGEELHGYGIMLEAARQSGGKYKLGPGTLYDNLKKLMAAGIVEESRRQPAGEDPRRRYYRLTGLGRRVLAEEIARLESVLREAKAVLKGRERKWRELVAVAE